MKKNVNQPTYQAIKDKSLNMQPLIHSKSYLSHNFHRIYCQEKKNTQKC